MNELRVWRAYRVKYGPMNDVRRFDRPAALLASIISSVYGGKAKQKDFMPFGQEEREPNMHEIVAKLGGVLNGKRR